MNNERELQHAVEAAGLDFSRLPKAKQKLLRKAMRKKIMADLQRRAIVGGDSLFKRAEATA